MKVVHISDWHTEPHELPSADLYVCTGDMFPNFPLYRYRDFGAGAKTVLWDPNGDRPRPHGIYDGRLLDPKIERAKQTNWISSRGMYRQECFGTNMAQVVCVRGNHDFVDLFPLFGEPCWEVNEIHQRVFEFQGLRIGGWRGVGKMDGEWSDEKTERQMRDELTTLSDNIDILITHVPPEGTMDYCGSAVGSIGSKALRDWTRAHPKLKLHCFGHSHGLRGIYGEEGGTVFSNAALGVNVIEL